jgi:SpoVK/Ycf46/Vps4 family AAA+-type ATPase
MSDNQMKSAPTFRDVEFEISKLDVPGSKKKRKAPEGGFTQWRQYGGSFMPEQDIQLAPETGAGQFETCSFGMGQPSGIKRVAPATDEIVRVKDTESDQIVKEISQFWLLGEKYQKHGITHKRGFLLYGPPGSGKTCTIWQVADEVIEKHQAAVIHGQHVGQITQVLQSIRQIEPDRKIIVVMEDIDQIVYQDEEGLLDLLDGKNQIDGVVYIATTNYLKRLPSRIRNRPSRFDRVVKVGKPSAHFRTEYIRSRNTDLSDEEITKWVVDTEGLSLAHIKELLVGTKVLGIAYDEVLGRVKEMSRLAEKEDAEADQSDE